MKALILQVFYQPEGVSLRFYPQPEANAFRLIQPNRCGIVLTLSHASAQAKHCAFFFVTRMAVSKLKTGEVKRHLSPHDGGGTSARRRYVSVVVDSGGLNFGVVHST